MILAAAGALLASVAQAHHSFGMFDIQKNVTVTGVVKDYEWTNPHAWIDLQVDGGPGAKPIAWAVEGDSIAVMERKGWTRKSVQAGDKAVLTVHPLRSGAVGGSLVSGVINGTQIGHAWKPQ